MRTNTAWQFLLALLLTTAACADVSAPESANADGARTAPTSIFDFATGEPVALNAPLLQTGDVICPESSLQDCTDPIDPCTLDPASCPVLPVCDATVGLSRTVRAGSAPTYSLEVSGTPYSDCGYLVMTGIGGRIRLHNDDSNWSTLAIEARRLYRDGSWGSPTTFRYGSEPNYALEAWGAIPQGYAIVGVGVGQGQIAGEDHNDLQTLVIRYRQLVMVNGVPSLTGPVYTANHGVWPHGAIDVEFTTTADNEVFVGAGFRSFNPDFNYSRTTTMEARLGLLQ